MAATSCLKERFGLDENPSPIRWLTLAEAKSFSHSLVAAAIRRKILKRPRHCEHCHKSPIETLSGHHPDYAKPLEVVWLCRKCHRKEHTRLKKEMVIVNFVATFKKLPGALELLSISESDNQTVNLLSDIHGLIEDKLDYWPEIQLLCKLP